MPRKKTELSVVEGRATEEKPAPRRRRTKKVQEQPEVTPTEPPAQEGITLTLSSQDLTLLDYSLSRLIMAMSQEKVRASVNDQGGEQSYTSLLSSFQVLQHKLKGHWPSNQQQV